MTGRVLTICGSFHPASANRAALDVATRFLRAQPAIEVCDSISVARLAPLDPQQLDVPPEAVALFRREVDEAHAVLVAGPEYAGGVAGSLKNALDWCVGSGGFYGKPVVVMSAGTSGGAFAIEQLARTLLWQGAHVVAHVGIAGPKSKSDGAGRLVDPGTLDAIDAACATLVEALTLSDGERARRASATGVELGIMDYPHKPD